MKTIQIVITITMLAMGTVVQAADPPASLSLVPEYINYQGRLVSPDGEPYSNATHKIELRLYEEASGGDFVWAEEYSTKTQDGHFSVLLGSGGTPLPGSSNVLWRTLWSEGGGSPDSFYMGVTVLTDQEGKTLAIPKEASPRQQFVTTPFAFRAHQSAYATKAAGEFQALEGINTPAINSSSDIVVSKTMRITGADSALHVSKMNATESSDLEIIGEDNKAVEVTADNGTVRVGYATPAGSPAVGAKSVIVGQTDRGGGSQTSVIGENVSVSAKTGKALRLNARNGTINIGYSPSSGRGFVSSGASLEGGSKSGSSPVAKKAGGGSIGTVANTGGSGNVSVDIGIVGTVASGAASINLGHTSTDINIQSDNLKLNGLPLFQFQKVSVSSPTTGHTVGGNCTIDKSKYDLMIVGYELSDPPNTLYVLSSGKVWGVFETSSGSRSGTVRVLGIRKGLVSGFAY